MFKDYSSGILLGAGHGIGLALDQKIRETYPHIELHSTFRDAEKNQNPFASPLDPLDEKQIAVWADQFKKIDFVISCVGWLGDHPEKSLRDIKLEQMTKSFQVNALHFPLVMKHLYRKLSKDSLISCLSAMVGSISDNQMGGWYGYRCSKTALNMIIKNMSLELKNSIVLGVHPGTTHTDLSKNFIGGIKHHICEAGETAEHLIQFWDKVQKEDSGKLFHWRGEEIIP